MKRLSDHNTIDKDYKTTFIHWLQFLKIKKKSKANITNWKDLPKAMAKQKHIQENLINMKKIILILITIIVSACNDPQVDYKIEIELTNQRGNKDTMIVYTDTAWKGSYDREFVQGLKLEDGNVINSQRQTVASGVYKYRILNKKYSRPKIK